MPLNNADDFNVMFKGLLAQGIKHGWDDREKLINVLNDQPANTVDIDLQAIGDELQDEKFINGSDFFRAVDTFTSVYFDDDE